MPFDHFDVIAPIYARVTYSSLEKMRELAGLPVKGRLLDIGGGTGRVASALLDDVDEVVIADVSMGMLRQTHRSTLKPVARILNPCLSPTAFLTALSWWTLCTMSSTSLPPRMKCSAC